MTLTIDGEVYAHGALALSVPDCAEIRALVANRPMAELHLAAFDEALHPRAHRGETGGGRFIKKLLHELAPGDTFEHPTLGRMERLPQGGSTRADGRLTVRSLATGKRVHMHPSREVAIPAPKAAPKVARVKRSTGASAFEKELKMRVGTPEAYHAAVTKMAGNRIVAMDKNGNLNRGQLEHDPHSGLRLVTATHVLEKRYANRPGWSVHERGMPEDLQKSKASLDAAKIIGGSKPERRGEPAYAETRIRKLGHVPPEEADQPYHPARMEHEQSIPFDPANHQGVRLASAERGVANPATLNKQFLGKAPSTRPAKPGPVTRPAEGYFPGSENETHVLHAKPDSRTGFRYAPSGYSGAEIARGTKREMEKLQREHAGSTIEPPRLTTVRFVSPIDGSTVERQLTPGELEKFNRLVEKPAEAKVADAKRGFAAQYLPHRSAAMESIRAVPLSQVEPGATYFDRHAEAMGVRGVEKKGGVEVHEGQRYGRALKPRIAAHDEVVHVKAGAQQSLTPGPQVGHVHVTYNGNGHGLVDNAGQVHAHSLTREAALARLRQLNDAYDKPVAASGRATASDHMNEVFNWGGVPTRRGDIIREMQAQGHDQGVIDRHIQGLERGAEATAAGAGSESPALRKVKLGDLNVGDRIHYASHEQAQRDYANKRGGQIHPPGIRGTVGEPYGEVVKKTIGSVHLHFPDVHRPGQSEEYSSGADVYVPASGGATSAGGPRGPRDIGPHPAQEPPRFTENMQGLHMPVGEPTTYGLRRGDPVYHPQYGEGVVQRVGAEPYTREHGVHIEWADGRSTEWPLGSRQFDSLRYASGDTPGSPVASAGRIRGVEHVIDSPSQAEADREAKYLREYQRRFGSAGSRAINRSLKRVGRRA